MSCWKWKYYHSIKQTANKRSTGDSQSIDNNSITSKTIIYKNSELTLGSTSTNDTNEKNVLTSHGIHRNSHGWN